MTQAAFELVAKCSGKLGSERYSVKPPPEFPVSRIASMVDPTSRMPSSSRATPLASPLHFPLAFRSGKKMTGQENGEAGACLKLL